ncbi:PAS domain-containing protein [Caulobacter sp. RHG1]|uniref:PAS domain-containing protein n=1 Tax=Caulobacter sp. (strain RHG1) TaxID=2545762 RepID=UPI00188490E0|nr:PAS domain-containing protein [Caulobacter sp. RHG1]NQE63838.1 Sensory box histidine kinase/response regulator [Caulobacter sp. RHG1]
MTVADEPSHSPSNSPLIPAFLTGGGEMGATVAGRDWSGSMLGAPEGWPPALKVATGMMLASPIPSFLAWGEDAAVLHNDAARNLLGAANATALGAPFTEVFPIREGLSLLARAQAGESVVRETVGFTRPDGEAAWCNLLFSPVRDENGLVQGVLVHCNDVTERVRLEHARIADERRYRALFESMDEGFCVIEFLDGPFGPLSDYVHIMANAAYERHAGIPNVVGQKLREMVGEEADAWVARYGAVLRTGEPIRFEQELVATGRHLSLSSFRIEPPELRQVAVLFQDVTARKQAEAELRRLNETLEARVAQALAERRLLADIVEGTNIFVQVADMDLNWLAINGASAGEFERIFGMRPQVGDNMLALLADKPEHQASVRAVWEKALSGEAFVEIGEFGEEGRERRYYEMRFHPLRDAEGVQVGAYQFVYDVTERLAEQERLREAEEALRQAQKMEAVGQLTGGLAHDFNNLLAGISGSFEMIGARLAQGRGSDVERYLAAGQGAARRAAALTHRLLAFSRRQTLAPRSVVINRLMADFAELVRRTVGPGIKVEMVAASSLWPTLVDANQLENALLNLCINARDAMPDGGRITIETGNRWLDARTARDHGLEPGQYVSVCVSDTGAGIDKATLERVFDPFFTTKPIGQGTGLGLSMVYGFARQSNGHVRIYSEVGEGTMVCLYLPRALGEEEVAPVEPTAPAAQAQGGKTVLVVDDEPTVRMLVVDALAELGYACLEAPDGATGLRILQNNDAIDLLITDVGLPGGLNGRQVADGARALRPDLRVLFITGYAENAVLNHGHIEHGMEVLTKPFAVSDLAARVDRMLREA